LTFAYALQDQIVRLEHELRLSKDDNQSLKAELTQLRTHQPPAAGASGVGRPSGEPAETAAAAAAKGPVDNSPPSERERRTINHMVKRYLVERGYKLTAITFVEEAEDELDPLPEEEHKGKAGASVAQQGPQSLTALQRHYHHNPAVQHLSAVQVCVMRRVVSCRVCARACDWCERACAKCFLLLTALHNRRS
jgi:hypothetical protein